MQRIAQPQDARAGDEGQEQLGDSMATMMLVSRKSGTCLSKTSSLRTSHSDGASERMARGRH